MNGKTKLKSQQKGPFTEPSTCASGWQAQPIQPLNQIRAKLTKDLAVRWGVSTRLHYARPIEALLSGARDEGTVRWRYEADGLEPHEYLRRFYARRECKDKVTQLCEYFKYHYEIPRIFLPGLIDIIDSFHDRKRNQIYHRVKLLIGKENIVGDETPPDGKSPLPYSPPACYSLLLKGLRPLKGGPLPMPPQEDTVALLARQLDKLRMSTISGEVSALTPSQMTPMTSVCFTLDEEGVSPTSLKGKVLINPSLTLKKQKKPTMIHLQLKTVKDAAKPARLASKPKAGALTQLHPQTTLALERKKSPRAPVQTKTKQKEKEISYTSTRYIVPGFDANTLARFRRELEEFQLAQSQSGRKNSLFASVKDPSSLTAHKSLSPKPTLGSSGRFPRDSMRLDSFKVLRTEPSISLFSGVVHALRPKENRSQDKISSGKSVVSPHKPPHSHKLSQQLTSVRSAGQSSDKEVKPILGHAKAEKSRDLASRLDVKSSRVSLSNLGLTSSPREFVLVKRLKSEEREDTEPKLRLFERKNTVTGKFNVITKLSQGSGLVKPSKIKEVIAGKNLSNGALPTSFRSKPKFGSIHFN